MKNLSNSYNQAKVYTAQAKLPAGAYKLKVKQVKYEEGQNGKSDVIIFAFDICEGEFKDFTSRSSTQTPTRTRSGREHIDCMCLQTTAPRRMNTRCAVSSL